MGACSSQQYGCCIAVDHDESIILNKPTGKEIRHGPGWFFFPYWWHAQINKAVPLQNNQYIIVQHFINWDNEHSNASVKHIPLEKRLTTDNTEQLLADDDKQMVEIIRGPQIYRVRNPYDHVSEIRLMINLSSTQYIIVTDKSTGIKIVESGPQLFCPGPYDEVGEVKSMYNLSSTDYIIVTDESTGEKITVTGRIQRQS
jgi:predicted ribosome-associated RNA-binding protein Tma20